MTAAAIAASPARDIMLAIPMPFGSTQYIVGNI